MARGSGANGHHAAQAASRSTVCSSAELALDVAFEELAELLASHASFCLTTHVSPDGDAIGSSLALAAILRSQGANVYLWHTEGDPTGFDVLGQESWCSGPPVDMHNRVAVVLDCSSPERAACDMAAFAEAISVVSVDHHASNTCFSDLDVVGPDAASTCSLLTRLADRMGVTLTPEMALPLYYGLWQDTGGLRYSNATPAEHALRDRLAAVLGPEAHASLEAALSYVPDSWHAYAALALDRISEIAPGVHFTSLDQADVAACAVPDAELGGANDTALDAILELPGRLHVFWYEKPDGTGSVSLRCNSDATDCSEIALAMGGGGHKAAAGFTPQGSRDETIAAIAAHFA
jgi:phosphoesterase RecJ-like protein